MQLLKIYNDEVLDLASTKKAEPNLLKRFEKLKELGKYEEGKAILALSVSNDSLKQVNPKNIDDVLLGLENKPTVATIAKYRGLIISSAILLKMVYWLKDMINVGKGISDAQAEFVCSVIIEDYSHYTLEDIKLILKKGAKGDFGKIYDALDPKTIISWFKEYDEQRQIKCSELRLKKHSQIKKGNTDANANKEGIAKIAKMFQDVAEKKKKKALEQTGLNAEDNEKLMQVITDEFQEYYKNWISKNGKSESSEEYNSIKAAYFNKRLNELKNDEQ